MSEYNNQRPRNKKRCCRNNDNEMTVLSVLWTLLSIIANILLCSGIYLPYWIKGRLGKADAYFSSFRRCNYPEIRPPSKIPVIAYECARYETFSDIPSVWWQVTTVAMVLSVAVLMMATSLLITALCGYLPEMVKMPKEARIVGSLHLLAAVFLCGGVAVYPIGWDNREVRESCGKSADVYNLGKCSISWSSYLLGATVALLILCFGLSFCVTRRRRPSSPQADPLRI